MTIRLSDEELKRLLEESATATDEECVKTAPSPVSPEIRALVAERAAAWRVRTVNESDATVIPVPSRTFCEVVQRRMRQYRSEHSREDCDE